MFKLWAFHYALLVLARTCLADRDAVAATHEGWLYHDQFCRMLGKPARNVRVDLYRARQQLAEAGVEGAGGHGIGEHIDFGVNAESKDCAVTIDPGHLEQVLMNLVVNARDAMPEGGSLMLESRRATIDGFGNLSPGEYVHLTVKDTG